MERVVIVVIVAVVAALVAAVVQRRRPAVEPVDSGHHVPTQLHRQDFPRPDAEWLVVVFTSSTCVTCAGTWDKARHLESDAVATGEVEVTAHPTLHERYRVDAVPTTVVADRAGVVRASFVGPVTATDLWAALAELREPGSVPDTCGSHLHEA